MEAFNVGKTLIECVRHRTYSYEVRLRELEHDLAEIPRDDGHDIDRSNLLGEMSLVEDRINTLDYLLSELEHKFDALMQSDDVEVDHAE